MHSIQKSNCSMLNPRSIICAADHIIWISPGETILGHTQVSHAVPHVLLIRSQIESQINCVIA